MPVDPFAEAESRILSARLAGAAGTSGEGALRRRLNQLTAANPELAQTPTATGATPLTGAAGTTSGNLAGATPFSYAGAYGGIPQVPAPQATQAASLGGNLANLPLAQQLAQQTNAFNIAQAPTPYVANLPNYQNILGQASGNALALTQGQLPADVVYQLAQGAAERGAAVGAGAGSPNTNAAYLKALGLNSLQAQQTGLNQFGQLMGLTPTAPLLNPATQFTTPEQQQAAQMAANLYSAAPIPAQKAAADLAALRSGVGAGRGSIGAPSGGGSTSTPTRPPVVTPPTFTANAAPTAPGRSYDPNASTTPAFDEWVRQGSDQLFGPSATVESASEALTNPFNLGGYNLGGYASPATASEEDYPGADANLDEIYSWLGI